MYNPNPTLVTTQSGLYTGQAAQRPLDIADSILRYLPDASPFTILSKKLSSKSVIDTTFKILEEQPQPLTSAVNNGAGYSAAATAMTVDHGDRFKAGDLVKVERTGEIFRITTVATNSLSVIVRGYGTTGAAAVVDNDPLRIIGSAFEDGSASSAIKTVKVDATTNYTQRFKEALQITDVIQNTKLYGEEELSRLRKSKGIVHMRKIEYAMIHGEKSLKTPATTIATTSDELRTTGGILSFISSNVKTLGDGTFTGGSTLTEADFTRWLEDVMMYPGPSGSTKRTLFASLRLISVIDGWGRDKLQTVPTTETYGIAVKEYLSSHGTINIIKHPELTGEYYGSYGILVDMSAVGYRYLQNLDTKLYMDISTRALMSGQVDQYETECGLYLALEALHGLIKGVNA